MIRWTVSALFPSGKSESESKTDSQAVCFLANSLSDSYYKVQYNTLTSQCNQIAALILSVSHMQLFSHCVLWPSVWMQQTDIHVAR